MSTKQDFINSILQGAIRGYKEFKILPSLTIAQAILESGWGKSAKGNNLFGIKWTDGCGYNKQVFLTTEYVNGVPKKFNLAFRKYDSLADSVYDHSKLLSKSRYDDVRKAKNYKEACIAVQKCGYATDPQYSKLLMGIIESNDLEKYDNQVLHPSTPSKPQSKPTPTPQPKVKPLKTVITTDVLNIRSIASTDGKIISQLKQGQKINIFEIKGHWGKISPNSSQMWVCLDYCK